jgi:hypothetical protein
LPDLFAGAYQPRFQGFSKTARKARPDVSIIKVKGRKKAARSVERAAKEGSQVG